MKHLDFIKKTPRTAKAGFFLPASGELLFQTTDGGVFQPYSRLSRFVRKYRVTKNAATAITRENSASNQVRSWALLW